MSEPEPEPGKRPSMVTLLHQSIALHLLCTDLGLLCTRLPRHQRLPRSSTSRLLRLLRLPNAGSSKLSVLCTDLLPCTILDTENGDQHEIHHKINSILQSFIYRIIKSMSY